MAIGRYAFSHTVRGGTVLATSSASRRIFKGVESGAIAVSTRLLQEGERLENIAAKKYGSSSMWWVIAAASGIGWGLQVPPGTILYIPTDLSKVYSLIR